MGEVAASDEMLERCIYGQQLLHHLVLPYKLRPSPKS